MTFEERVYAALRDPSKLPAELRAWIPNYVRNTDTIQFLKHQVPKLTELRGFPGGGTKFLRDDGTFQPVTTVVDPGILPGIVSGSNTSFLVANTAYLIPIAGVVTPSQVSRICFHVSNQSGNMDVGIYYTDDEIIFTRLFSQGSFAVPAVGSIRKFLTSTQTITPVASRRWFWGFAVNNGTATFIVGNPGAGSPSEVIGCYSKVTSFPLPASLTSVANADGTIVPAVHGLN